MKFKDYLYERPNLNVATEATNKIINLLNSSNDLNSDNFNEVVKEIEEYNKIRLDIDTMYNLAFIRQNINTLDEFYNQEVDYFDENIPFFDELEHKFYNALSNSKYKDKLISKYGQRLFDIIELKQKTFSPEIIPELQEEGKLISKYSKLIASAKISFDGKVLNLSELGPYLVNPSREIRKNAEEAGSEFFKNHEDDFDEIYDKLVSVRTKMAQRLGYKNYIELGYKRLERTDYNEVDVKGYRDEVLETIVPLATKIYKKQAEMLKIKDFRSYDMKIVFPEGNSKPSGETNELINKAIKMYDEMSRETSEFVHFMFEHELTDLETKKGKVGGGYCTYLPNYKSPFVFSNFNGTSDDIEVLTHEFGHALQVYLSRDLPMKEYFWPTMESAEIHSMSMEFFSYPWMKLFFNEEEKKYKYEHLASTLTFIPYGVTVDEFQHVMYSHPELTKEERKKVWREIEQKYIPAKIYDNDFYNKGTWWYKQGHIFQSPFYYIDYTLAQNCAHQFFIKDKENHEKAWNDYKELCTKGGSMSFLELLKVANLKNPFSKGTVKETVSILSKYLEDIN